MDLLPNLTLSLKPDNVPDRATSETVDQIIHVLPDVLANKIAAGEVVERPASAVKELVENSIDAGSSRIQIRLMASGADLIEIVDDGCGMCAADAELAFRRHATSKIRSIEDLERVRTLGFRGEAVASIAAVSRASIRTKRRGDDAGVEVAVHGGEMISSGPTAAADGTVVSISNLFYNVPARRKFLKAPATEFRRIVEVVEGLSLSHPDISFTLSNDGKDLISVTGTTVKDGEDPLLGRIVELFALKSGDDLIPVSEETSYLSVYGFVGRMSMNRKSRGRQYLFVNGRLIKNRYLEHAVRNAYQSLLKDGEHPFFVLFLDLDPAHVDVNVHPTKAEVKFDDERGVYSLVKTVVAKSLSDADLAPQADELDPAAEFNWRFDSTQQKPAIGFDSFGHFQSGQPGRSTGIGGDLSALLYGSDDNNHGDSSQARDTDVDGDPSSHERVDSGLFLNRERPAPLDIWQIDSAFLVVQLRHGLLVIDQSAAHERVLYERARESLAGGGGFSQQLLFPQTVEFSAADFSLVESLVPDLRKLGFDVDLFGGRSVVLRGVPTGVKDGSAESLLVDVIGQYREFHDVKTGSAEKRLDSLARSVARRSSIRTGEALTQSEMRGLVDQLLICENPWHSPNGKTAVVRIGASELARMLNR